MNHKVIFAGLLSVMLLAGANCVLAWEIPLTVENSARPGVPPFVSGGVPLLAGQAKEAGELRLAVKGPDGKLAASPAQFRVLARWWREGSLPSGDNSIRWVLVDFDTSDVPGEKKVVYLTNATIDAPAPKSPTTVRDSDDAIVVSTGAATFTVSRRKFNFLDRVVVDGEDLLDSSPDLFAVLYHLTGEQKYKDIVHEKTYNGSKLLRAAMGDADFFPPAAHWLLNQPPRAGK